MKDKLRQFIKESPLAGRVRLGGKVVVHRTRLRPRDLAGIRRQGVYTATGDETCQLFIGSQLIASGKIIEKDGVYFFQSEKTSKEDKA